MNYELKLRPEYFEAIKSGAKKYEGRLGNKQEYIKKSMLIDFVNNQTEEKITRKVISVGLFGNFKEMLESRFELFLPDCRSLEEAVEVYHSISDYEEKVNKYGALAIELGQPGSYFHTILIAGLFFITTAIYGIYKLSCLKDKESIK